VGGEPLLQLAGGVTISFWVLLMGGLLGGLTAGLFGVGGGVIVTPLLIGLGVPPHLAAGSMNVAIISNAAEALAHDLPKRKVDGRLGLVMGLGAVVGGQAGTYWIGGLQRPLVLDQLIRGGFLVVLVWLAARLLRGRKPRGEGAGRWLFHMPLRYTSPWEDQPVSALAPLLVSVGGGLVASLLGVGGGIFYVPLLLALFHRPMQDIIPVSQIAVLLGTLSVSTGHVLHTGHVDPRLALILVVAGSTGTVVGSRLKTLLESRMLEKLLALVLVLAALRLTLPLFGVGLGNAALASGTPPGADWLRAYADWCAGGRWELWLGTVGMALGMAPLLGWLQHRLLDRVAGKA